MFATVYPAFSLSLSLSHAHPNYCDGSGDSYTQTGFNLTNGSPMPAPGNPMGNPVYPGWTSAKYE